MAEIDAHWHGLWQGGVQGALTVPLDPSSQVQTGRCGEPVCYASCYPSGDIMVTELERFPRTTSWNPSAKKMGTTLCSFRSIGAAIGDLFSSASDLPSEDAELDLSIGDLLFSPVSLLQAMKAVPQASMAVSEQEGEPVVRRVRLDTETEGMRSLIARVLEVSGLSQARLGGVLGVSRIAINKWKAGTSKPRGQHHEHLLEVLSVVEEAARRLASANATRAWLLTPVIPGGRKPIDYLQSRRYSAFRGFLLRSASRSEAVGVSAFPDILKTSTTREERRHAVERIRPRGFREDYDEESLDKEAPCDITRGEARG